MTYDLCLIDVNQAHNSAAAIYGYFLYISICPLQM